MSDEIILHGIPASSGIAEGPALIFLQKELEVPRYDVPEDARADEVRRFETAILKTREQIARLAADVEARLGADEARIFEAHLLVLEDPALIDETIREQAASNANIEACLQTVVRRYIDVFSRMDDAYLKERLADIRDVARRLLRNMLGAESVSLASLGAPRVVAARDLTPSDTAGIDRANILAFLTDEGSRTSHTVIMARSMQVPAVVGLGDVSARLRAGDIVIVDGEEGTVVVNPTEETRARYRNIAESRRARLRRYERIAACEAVTADGAPFVLRANIGGAEELDAVKRSGAEGVGLFRTENLFLRAGDNPTEDAQFEEYRAVAAALAPAPVTIRTLDLGGDKTNAAYRAESADEANPFMGFRAVRYCLKDRELFKTQLRAILRASAFGKIRLMFPMISGVAELLEAKAVLDEARAELRARGAAFDMQTPVGAMIEIPSAALTVDLLAKHCDFFSVGTNDLIQYAIAVDRVNTRVSHLYDPTHPAVLRLLWDIAQKARAAGVPVGVCGEMAGEPIFAPLFLGLGFESLSAAPALLPEIKYHLRGLRMDAMRDIAVRAVAAEASASARRLLEDFLSSRCGDSDLQG